MSLVGSKISSGIIISGVNLAKIPKASVAVSGTPPALSDEEVEASAAAGRSVSRGPESLRREAAAAVARPPYEEASAGLYQPSLYKNFTSLQNATDFLKKYGAESIFDYHEKSKRFFYKNKTVSTSAFTQLQVLDQLRADKLYGEESDIYFKSKLTVEEANKFLRDHNAAGIFKYLEKPKRFFYIDDSVSKSAFTQLQVLSQLQSDKKL